MEITSGFLAVWVSCLVNEFHIKSLGIKLLCAIINRGKDVKAERKYIEYIPKTKGNSYYKLQE